MKILLNETKYFKITEERGMRFAHKNNFKKGKKEMKHTFKRSFISFLTLLALTFNALANVSLAQADSAGATLTVMTIADNTTTDGLCSLREAIFNADDDAATYSDCAAGTGNDTIEFDNALGAATITLGSTLPAINDPDGLSINGGSYLTVDGAGLYQVFYINAGAALTLDGLTVSNGFAANGSGARNYGMLTVTNSTFSRNIAQGGNGGGIFNSGNSSTLTITNSTFSRNIAQGSRIAGGAIFNDRGTLTVTNSTFFGNIAQGGDGGGIFNYRGTLTITNSTFSDNSATASRSCSPSTGCFPIGGIGGGLYNIGTINLANTLIANSISGEDCVTYNAFGSNVNNLVEDGSCLAALSGDPSLGALADNEAPTQTMTLLAGSRAIDAGDNTVCPATDQRGVTRDASCDIGALEYSALLDGPAPTVDPLVQVNIGGNTLGNYNVPFHTSLPLNYSVNSGPVKVTSTNNLPFFVAERHAWLLNGAVQSVSELMGLPANQVTDTYYMPWYDSVTMDTQLRFANLGNTGTNITVTIAGVAQPAIPLAAGASTRVSYPGINNGPVKVQSSGGVPIAVTERGVWLLNGVVQSFSELKGLPGNQLTDTYYFPWYNNLTMDTQLRLANLGNTSTNITVTIAGVAQPAISLGAGASIRVSYPVNNGPVKVQSSGGAPIIVSERGAWLKNGVAQSFSEMMGLPSNQLTTTYYFPWYNNVTMDTQLRLANLGNTSTSITVTIADVAQSPITVAAGQSTRISYPVNSGPVKVESSGGVPIIVTERDVWLINGVVKSFSEMMGLPGNQLTTTYYFPWYNNATMDTQLRFAVP
jgi:hypothetical protein